MSISRRSFIKTLGAIAGIAATPSVLAKETSSELKKVVGEPKSLMSSCSNIQLIAGHQYDFYKDIYWVRINVTSEGREWHDVLQMDKGQFTGMTPYDKATVISRHVNMVLKHAKINGLVNNRQVLSAFDYSGDLLNEPNRFRMMDS